MEIKTSNGSYWKTNHKNSNELIQSIHEGDGKIRRLQILEQQKYLPIDLELWELKPGVSEGDHTHDGHDGEPPLTEIYYFIEGEGIMTIDEETVEVKSGDTVMVPPNIDHGVYNNHPEKTLKMLIIWGEPPKQ